MTTVAQWLIETGNIDRRDREILLEEIAGVRRAQTIAFPDTVLSDQHVQKLDHACAQLRDGTPLAYVLGHQEFWSLQFNVTPATLIPRPETELLVEQTLALAPVNARVLELGTGSGAIAIAVARSRTDLQVTATDLSMEALHVARANAERLGTAVEFLQANWFDDVDGHWQVIVSNPPYIAAGDVHLPALAAEPRQALVAGSDGLDDLRNIIQQAPAHLSPGGHLIVEHGYDQAPAVRTLMESAGYVQIRAVKDLAQIERATLGCRQ